MISADYCQVFAQYNTWVNGKIYDVCDAIDDVQRRRDAGAFFGSIHNTLNHIVYGDLAFMSRFTGEPAVVPELGVELYEDFGALGQARDALDRRICAWAAQLTTEWLSSELSYVSKVDGLTRTMARWVVVTHMFNHQTHHRGQITTMLSQMGIDIGATDIPFMPQFQH